LAVASRHASALGVFAPETGRSIVVVSRDGETAVALRERTEPSVAVIRDVRPDEIAAGIAACLPFPWMVVNDLAGECCILERTLRRRPVLCCWRAPVPPGLPRHVREYSVFSEVATRVEQALRARVAGLQLAPHDGVQLSDGPRIASPRLDALVAQHPHAFDLPRSVFAPAARALSARGIPARIVQDRSRGGVVLVGTSA